MGLSIDTLRANILGGMHSYICDYGDDEDIIEKWLRDGVPDDADEDDIMEIAIDKAEFNRICQLFSDLVNHLTF